MQTLYELRRLCYQLFALELEIDWGTSDHAEAFVNAHLQYNMSPDACDDPHWYRKQALSSPVTPTSDLVIGKPGSDYDDIIDDDVEPSLHAKPISDDVSGKCVPQGVVLQHQN